MLILYYCIMNALFTIALIGTRPIISLYAYQSGASEALIGAMVSCYALLPMLLAVYFGKWLDRFGARAVTLCGGAGMSLAIILPSIYPYLSMLFLSQLLMGLSYTCVLLSIQKTFGNMKGDRDRLIATFSLSTSLGELGGPLLSGFTYDKLGFSLSYAILGCIAVTALLMGLFLSRSLWSSGAPSKREMTAGTEQSGNTWGLLKNINLRNALIISGLVLFSKDLFMAYFPIYATNLGIGSSQIGFMLSAMAGMAILVRTVQFHLVKRFGRSILFLVTLIVSGAAYIMVPFVHLPILLTLLAMIMGAGLGLGQPLSLVFAINSSPSGRQGEVLGLRLTFNRASQFSAPFLFGALGSAAGVSPIFWVSGAVLLMGTYFTRVR